MYTLANAILANDRNAIARVAAAPVLFRNDNLVARPWGGEWLGSYKGLHSATNRRWGEAFEVCANTADEEAAAHPSTVQLADGSEITLPTLLDAAGDLILGSKIALAYGSQFPLLPKTLDVRELLSVQAHPAGLTETYIIIKAEEDASIRLGFRRDVDRKELTTQLTHGRAQQVLLLDQLGDNLNIDTLQHVLASNFAQRSVPVEDGAAELEQRLEIDITAAIVDTLRTLKRTYWHVLGLLNEIAVKPGQVIYNATPSATGLAGVRQQSAEIHALGNPQNREILVLEVRRPGVTYRAWDNVRFPLRDVDVEKSLQCLNLTATRPEDFLIQPEPVADRPGVYRSVEDASFVINHLRPHAQLDVSLSDDTPMHTLHVIKGNVELRSNDGETLARLRNGQSALIPDRMRGYTVSTNDTEAEIVMVTIPI